MAVSRAARLLVWAAGLLPFAPRTCHALWLDRDQPQGGRRPSWTGPAWHGPTWTGPTWTGPAWTGPATNVDPDEVATPPPTPTPLLSDPAFPVCFVHVGKCAGASVARALNRIEEALNSSGTKNGTAWKYLQIHTYNGPVTNPEIKQDCLSRKILLWVRDPMERLMASWRFEVEEFHGEFLKKFLSRYPHLFTTVPPSSEDRSSDWPPELFDLNYVAGMVQKHVANGGGNLDEDFAASFHHGNMGLSYYLGPNAVALDGVPNEQIFVGRVEHMEEDWNRFLALLQIPLRSDTMIEKEHREHETTKLDIPLSSDAVSLLRRIAQPDYAVMEKLKVRGLLSADYLDSFVHRTKFNARMAAPRGS